MRVVSAHDISRDSLSAPVKRRGQRRIGGQSYSGQGGWAGYHDLWSGGPGCDGMLCGGRGRDLPKPFHQIFCGGCSWSLRRLPEIHESLKGWVSTVFPNPTDPYDRVWHQKLGFLVAEDFWAVPGQTARVPARSMPSR